MAPPKVNENSSMDVTKIFTTLANRGSSLNDRQQAYSSLTRYLNEEDGLSNPYVQGRKDQLLKFLLQDSLADNNEIVKDILQILQFYITDDDSSKTSNESTILQVLLKASKGERSEEVNHSVLNCLALQKFQPAVFTSEIPLLLERLEEMHGRKRTHLEPFLERLVDAVFRLEEQLGQNFTTNSSRFILLVIRGVTHPLQDTRMKSLEMIRRHKSSLTQDTDFARQLVKFINSDFSKNLKTFLSKDCEHLTKVWTMILDIVGKAIHKGPTINIMLQIIEPAFKGQVEARILAFRAWKSLVDNFALDPDVISEPKRIRLLMMVMKIDNAKTEAVAVTKLNTWWHFVRRVGSKLSTNFEQIIYPLLQFCAGTSKLHSTNSPHVSSSWMSLSMTGQGNQGPARGLNQSFHDYPALKKVGCEIVGHILSKSVKGDAPLTISWTLDPIPADVFTSPASFVKHAPFVMSAALDLFKKAGPEIEESVVLHIWRSLSNQLRWAMDNMKMECRDAFSSFLSHLHAICQGDLFKEELLFKMLLTSCNFSHKILASTAFNVVGGNVRGCPALLLAEILFMPAIVKYSSSSEQYIKLFSNLVNAGVSNSQGALVFLQSVTDLVNSRVLDLASSDFLWRLWSTIAHTLHEHISSTNEVNQGDALEYNFGCLYTVLLVPIQRQMPSKVSQAVSKTIMRTWKEIYHTFARLSALVATAEANTCLEELSFKMIQSWQPEFKDPSALEFLSGVCQKMLDCTDFSALSVSQSPGSGLTLSPGKWAKRRTRPMANLHSFVHLVAKVQSEINDLLTNLNENKLDLAVHAVVEICTALFSHITAGLVAHVIAALCPPLSRLYRNEMKTGSVKLFIPSLMTKLEKLWQEIVNCITGRYSDQYDSHFLSLLSPMLEATFLHNRRGIKNQTLTLWSSTFSKSATLVYPDDLKSVLSKVKEKTALVLPGWIISPEQVVAETPFSELSQISQGDSQIPTPVLPGLPSPKRQAKGSFISRDISPARPSLVIKLSPAKVVSPKEVKSLFSSSRKNTSLDLNLMPEEEFVVITSPPKRKRRLLTEHQKEVLKEKSVIPAMYNNLDASIDISMSTFNDTQQESLSSMPLVTRQESGSDHAQEPKVLTAEPLTVEGQKQPFKDLSGDTSSSMGSTNSKFPQVARRSVRISGLKSDGAELSVALTKLNEEEKPELNMRKTKLKLDASNESSVSSDLSKKSTKCLPTPFPVDAKEKPMEDIRQCTVDLEMEKGIEPEPAVFKMFRTRSQNLESGMSKTVESTEQTETPKIHTRRVSLRKVQSDDISLSSDKTEDAQDSSVGGKAKSPRRVPLRKLNEQTSQQDEKKEEPAGLSLRSSKSRQQENGAESVGERTNNNASSHNVPAVNSTLSNWLLRGKKKTDDSVTVAAAVEKSPPLEQSEPGSLLTCQNKESFTLVEETQSPSKMNSQKNENLTSHESIAETPTKSDDNTSPLSRVTRSARKLFTDSETADEGQTEKATCQPDDNEEGQSTGKSRTEEIIESGQKSRAEDSEVPLFDSDPIISSSQGFDVPLEKPKSVQKEIAETPLSSADGSEISKDSSKTLCSVEDSAGKNEASVPQSEVLQDSTAQTSHSSDDMPLMAMPTLASQSDLTITKSTQSSSSAKTSSSDENNDKKLTASSESEFNLSQSTLMDDSSEKMVKERTIMSTRLRLQAKTKKSYHCFSPKKDASQSGLISKTQEKQTSDDAVNHEDPQQFTVIEKKSAKETEGNKEKVTAEIPVIGEVTPDVKSPSQSSPVKRSSTTKNRRRAAKRLSKQLNEVSREGVDESSSLSVLDEDSAGNTAISESSMSKLTKTQSLQRGRSVLSSPRSTKKHLLRTRTKVVRRLSASPPVKSPPKRGRTLKRMLKERSDSEDADDKPLSSLKKRRVMAKSGDESTDDDDKPLSSIIPQKTQNIAETACLPSIIIQKIQNVAETTGSPSVITQKTQNIAEIACSPSIITQNVQNVVETACSPSIITQNVQNVAETACSPSIITQKIQNVEDSAVSTDDKEKNAISQTKTSPGSDEKVEVILDSVPENTTEEEEMDASEELILSSEVKCPEIDAKQSEIADIQNDAKCAVTENISQDLVNNLKQPEIADDQNEDECAVLESVSQDLENNSKEPEIMTDIQNDDEWAQIEIVCQEPEKNFKRPDFGDHLYSKCALEANLDVDNTDLEIAGDGESMEADSPSLLAQAPQVTLSSQEDEKMEVVDEPSQESSGSDEVFEKEKQMCAVSSLPAEDIVDESEPHTVEETTVNTNGDKKNEKAEMAAEEEEVDGDNDSGDSDKLSPPKTPVKEKEELEQEVAEYIPSQWSPSKSPSCSILKKPTPVSEKNSRRVSFAEPVVSGHSPVREKYHAESLPTSPLISNNGHAPTKFSRSSSSAGKLMNRGTPYRRRLEGSLRKNDGISPRQRNSSGQSSSSQSQNSYRATQESQLDAVNPIFPDLVDCKTSLDCILPQLTSSLWHRGLCQLMKGRNLHTIGDLSSLTEVQINQMPIRHPKVQTVRDTLMTYLNQHGNSKGSKSIFACAATPLDGEAFNSPKSSGATLEQAVTPSSIADEGMKILPSVEEDLSQLSPIRDPNLKSDDEVSQPQASNEATSSSSGKDESESVTAGEKVISSLSSFIATSQTGLKDVSMTDLFDIHQKLNTLLGVVVDQMKERQNEQTKSKT